MCYVRISNFAGLKKIYLKNRTDKPSDEKGFFGRVGGRH